MTVHVLTARRRRPAVRFALRHDVDAASVTYLRDFDLIACAVDAQLGRVTVRNRTFPIAATISFAASTYLTNPFSGRPLEAIPGSRHRLLVPPGEQEDFDAVAEDLDGGGLEIARRPQRVRGQFEASIGAA